VLIKAKFEFERADFEKEITLRMIYQDEAGETLTFGQKGGEWKFIDSFFFHIIESPMIDFSK
jgi:hypothetical protein